MAHLDDVSARHGDRVTIHTREEGTTMNVPEIVAAIAPGTEVYVCGPIRLMDAVRRAWLDRGLPIADLRMETFGNSGWFEPQEFVVRIPATGLETRVKTNQTMLEALENAGADMLSDCRKGECGLREVRIAGLKGDIDHRDVFYSERQRDARERCAVACPASSHPPATRPPSRSSRREMQKGRPTGAALLKRSPAVSYSPTGSPLQYHRRCEA